ncbi:class E sortase [Streptomyces silaceus]|uniref:class E sortase n=1 Tax=Streptomyces silaceus TaxID=545123 RepID=UPI0006EBAEC2
MTALRPERDSSGAPYDASDAYGDGGGVASGGAGGLEGGALEAAVDHLADPLTNPLPGQHPSPWFRSAQAEQPPRAAASEPQQTMAEAPQPSQVPQPPQTPQVPQALQEEEWYDPAGYARDWYGEQAEPQPQPKPQPQETAEPTYEQLYGAYAPERPAPEPEAAYETRDAHRTHGTHGTPEAIPDDETVALRTEDTRRIAEPEPARPTEGRAARRKAAKKGGARPAAPARPTEPRQGAPLSRLEARRAERARRPSPGAVISRGLGEVFITVGVLMLLFVTYQLWWTNIRAQQQADGAAHDLQESWAKGKGKPGAFEPGQGFALLHIPRLDVVVPVAEGIDKQKVLDRGMVGHYNEGGATKTPMPDAKQGNFAVAGHRNTHGEPFRYINRLEPGDPIVVETQDKYFVYKMASILPQTSPSNTGVIGPVPPGSGFTKPGRYITLTTCTPEFTSKYRMIVWGKMVEERPRSKGKPSALVN